MAAIVKLIVTVVQFVDSLAVELTVVSDVTAGEIAFGKQTMAAFLGFGLS